MIVEAPACWKRACKHYRTEQFIHPEVAAAVAAGADDDTLDALVERLGLNKTPASRMVCDAFPAGIPTRILYGPDLHTTIAPDQMGDTVYERDPDAPARS